MREGKPVTWLFLAFIIICYVGFYIQSITTERDYYYNIATQQQKTLTQQNETIVKLKLMLEYITGYKFDEVEDSPIHNKNEDTKNNYVHPI